MKGRMGREIDPQLMEFGSLATSVINQKYAQYPTMSDRQTWPKIARRVAENVLGAVNASQELIDELTYRITIRQILPGGRYLYAAGRDYHQVQNCLLGRPEDSREGWAQTLQDGAMTLMSGAGLGNEYSQIRPKGSLISRTGGEATGPCSLMRMLNECGRHIMQGGSRRSAIWAGLGWDHPDIFEFIHIKDWSEEVRAMKAKDYNFPAQMDGTNISVRLDDEFFLAYYDEVHPKHSLAQQVYWETVYQMLKTGEPGFSIDTGKNSGETLRNAPVCKHTNILTIGGYKTVSEILEIPVTVWTGKQWAENVVFSKTCENTSIVKVKFTGGREIRCDEFHPFFVEIYKGAGSKRKLVEIKKVSANNLKEGDILHISLPTCKAVTDYERDVNGYTLGYVYGDGTFNVSGNAEITFCTDEKKECAKFIGNHSLVTSTNMNDGRGHVRMYFSVNQFWNNRNKNIFPVTMYAADYKCAGSFLAGLFDADGNYEESQNRIRLSSNHEDFLRGVSRLLEQYGILSGVSKNGNSTFGQKQSYQLVIMSEYVKKFVAFVPTIRLKFKLEGYEAYRPSLIKVLEVVPDGTEDVYCADVKVSEHSFMAEGAIISNCTEITSQDDSDICNLGSINMARIHTLDDMLACVSVATAMLVAGTEYSDVPYAKVKVIREKNRRLGLGLMGLHEWLITHGKKYGPDEDLEQYLKMYEKSTEFAHYYEKQWNLSPSVKTRALAPCGSIGIAAETTTSCEPMLCVAYKRRYLNKDRWQHQYVVENVAKRLIETQGVRPESIEDAYTIPPERRVQFQHWLQKYVDHGISSTINLPAWGSPTNNPDTVKEFGMMLLKYLPDLRGITCYPDGARSGQPLTAVSYKTAMKHVGEIFYEQGDICDITKGGSCGA